VGLRRRDRRARRRSVFTVARPPVKRVASTDTFVGSPDLEDSFAQWLTSRKAMRELHVLGRPASASQHVLDLAYAAMAYTIADRARAVRSVREIAQHGRDAAERRRSKSKRTFCIASRTIHLVSTCRRPSRMPSAGVGAR